MLRTVLKALVKFVIIIATLISPTAPALLDMGKIPDKTKTVDMSKFTDAPVWEDNFDGTEIDRTKWNFPWWETERKGGYWHEDMASVKDGNLIIRAEYLDEPLENRYYDAWKDKINFKEYKPGWYTACLRTADLYEQCYGYFEVRCKLPAATGMWSAFWMMNHNVEDVDGTGKDGTEVDIFESMYYKDYWWGNDAVISGIVYDGYGEHKKGDSLGKIYVEGDPYNEFNTYGLEWSPTEYIFYINGVETGRMSTGGVSQNPEYLILSCEFAGENGVQWSDRHGTGEISKTPEENWPAEFVVDYVKCYQYKEFVK